MTRKITEEEKKLWKLATKGVKGREAEIDDFLHAAAKVKIKLTSIEEIMPTKLISKKPAKELIGNTRNQMDAGNFSKLKKGQIKIDATIDLHGMWLADAHKKVRSFIETSHASGRRCVLVITGKGGLSGDGKIRSEFPSWLNEPELRSVILSFTSASSQHGGSGAFYVYLRK